MASKANLPICTRTLSQTTFAQKKVHWKTLSKIVQHVSNNMVLTPSSCRKDLQLLRAEGFWQRQAAAEYEEGRWARS